MTTRNSIAGAALVAAVTLFTVTAAPAQVQTGPGYALSVTNAGQYVTAAIPALASNYTISAWVFLNGGGDLFSHRVGVLSATNCCGSVEVLVRSDSVLSTDPQYLELGRCGCFNGAGSAGVVPINQWVHLAVSVELQPADQLLHQRRRRHLLGRQRAGPEPGHQYHAGRQYHPHVQRDAGRSADLEHRAQPGGDTRRHERGARRYGHQSGGLLGI